MSKSDKFTLYVYEGDYGLPSMDIQCTKILLYCSMLNLPLKVRILNRFKLCMFYRGPHFVHRNLTFSTFGDVVLYLNTRGWNLDKNLTSKQKSECLAFSTLVDTKLRPVFEFLVWVDDKNYEDFIRVWYAKALPLPFNIITSKRLKTEANNLVESLYPADYTVELIREEIPKLITDCLPALSNRLGNSDYFFGNTPSTLDIMVYSYLAPLMKLKIPTNSALNMIEMWPNLMGLVKRIDNNYFPNLPKGPKYIKIEETRKTSDDEVSYVAITILTISAVTLVGFAMTRGIVFTKIY